jgi:hypothetical protein
MKDTGWFPTIISGPESINFSRRDHDAGIALAWFAPAILETVFVVAGGVV